MKYIVSAGLAVWLLASPVLLASDVEGTVVIKRRLTRKRVTAPTSPYSRGAAVALKTESVDDYLELERSRVVVYLEGRLPSVPPDGKSAPVRIVQEGRRFLPDTVVVPAGATVEFPNLDPIFHNVFSLSKAKSFDLGNYDRNHTRSVTFDHPGIVLVHCHLHPNMAAAVFVAPNATGTLAARSGSFSIRDVPPGTYTAVAWHPAAGFFRQRIVVTASATPKIEFFIPLDAEPAGKHVARR